MLIWLDYPPTAHRRFLFLDRDGIINKNSPYYVKNLAEFIFYEDALQSLRLLEREHISVILISNQSGIGRGLIPWEAFWGMHDGMIKGVKEAGGRILAAFYCPHKPDENCSCRKPSPGMLLATSKRFGIDLDRTVFIGDHATDVEAANRAGCSGIRVCRDPEAGGPTQCSPLAPTFPNLLEAISHLLRAGF
jgi:D-glycero-D-manno-heptose 1,7-bisphosphate phosphatase